ncbi:hypothetical protein [uncultured Paraglaciecola sp.]|uniref:hypothetical protein n=1 Tax=uncultured Paraglaciecola sp. TaxID=1765024 RepID=UPI00263724FE|nr:hypothetical protein [uncultured Paraglaciecola sp.]
MIELLTRLNTKQSAFPDNQAEYGNTSQLCPACAHRSRKAIAEDGGCSRCGGTRRLGDTGNQNQTRGKGEQQGMTPQYIAALLAGLPAHKVDAALVYVNDDTQAAGRLMEYMVNNVIRVAAHGWRLNDKTRNVRIAGLAATSTIDLARYPSKLETRFACPIVGVSATQWKSLWKERSEVFFMRMYGWTDDVNQHMYLKHNGPYEKSA